MLAGTNISLFHAHARKNNIWILDLSILPILNHRIMRWFACQLCDPCIHVYINRATEDLHVARYRHAVYMLGRFSAAKFPPRYGGITLLCAHYGGRGPRTQAELPAGGEAPSTNRLVHPRAQANFGGFIGRACKLSSISTYFLEGIE